MGHGVGSDQLNSKEAAMAVIDDGENGFCDFCCRFGWCEYG